MSKIDKIRECVIFMCRNIFPKFAVYIEPARSKTKCNIFGRQCCMGKIYEQLSIEERTMN